MSTVSPSSALLSPATGAVRVTRAHVQRRALRVLCTASHATDCLVFHSITISSQAAQSSSNRLDDESAIVEIELSQIARRLAPLHAHTQVWRQLLTAGSSVLVLQPASIGEAETATTSSGERSCWLHVMVVKSDGDDLELSEQVDALRCVLHPSHLFNGKPNCLLFCSCVN